jgi:hypothetical protein
MYGKKRYENEGIIMWQHKAGSNYKKIMRGERGL